ncbi:MAG: PA2778 family cysteine peptidase, partial [Desulfobacterales bacterium]
FFPQKAYQCGPATLSMALGWSGIRVTPNQVMPEVFTPSLKGSLQSAIIGSTRRHGRIAFPIHGMDMLLRELVAGHPVIILQNLGFSWLPVWHYSIVVGYHLSDNVVILHSGTTPRKRLSMKTFAKTWSRSGYWGLLVLSPHEIPVTADEKAYILAVIGLEKARHWDSALKGYQTALKRWPDSLGAYMGVSNSYYALGEWEAAAVSLKKAIDRFPEEGVLFNNLAQVQFKQKKVEEALYSIRQAIQLGGPLSQLYQKTLDEILSAMDSP